MFGLFFDYICFVTLLSHLLALRPSSSPSPPLLLLCMMGAATENSFPSVLCMQVSSPPLFASVCAASIFWNSSSSPKEIQAAQTRLAHGVLSFICYFILLFCLFPPLLQNHWPSLCYKTDLCQLSTCLVFMSNIITSPNYKVHIFTQ